MAEDAANFRQRDVGANKSRRSGVTQIVKAHGLDACGAPNGVEASLNIVGDAKDEIVRAPGGLRCDCFQFPPAVRVG